MYTYMTPQEVWYGKEELTGRSMAYAYWNRHSGQSILPYKFTFKPLRGVTIGPHAYTLWFDDERNELISYDTVCVYTVILEKS